MTTINTQRVAYRVTTNGLKLPDKVVKRSGAVVPFDLGRIARALDNCYTTLETPLAQHELDQLVTSIATAVAGRHRSTIPTVEQVQDIVEMTLLGAGEVVAANHYIAYRDTRKHQRGERVPEEVRATFDEASWFFPTQLQQFQFFDKYSRFNWDLMRRETWIETVDRNITYMKWLVEQHTGDAYTITTEMWDRIYTAIMKFEAMPSMRSLSQAGPAAMRNSMAIYNCSYLPLADFRAFSEIMLISMAGCGVGWSVEAKYVEQLPRVKRYNGTRVTHVVDDSAEGWAASVLFGLERWAEGFEVQFDYSQVRGPGAPLMTKGGRASGPEPLKRVHEFCRSVFAARQGGYLTTLDAHDMACMIAGAAVSGGQRRTAAISLFDFDDELMRNCKTGHTLDVNPQRWNANNSAVWPDDLTQTEVASQMIEMIKSERGEPGIFSRVNANRTKPDRREEADFGINPCGEIYLRPFGLCNLSIAVARADDTYATLAEKVAVATMIGTIQSLATTFPHMRDEWANNCIDERLLGVDITGQADCPLLTSPQAPMVLEQLKQRAIATNKQMAALLGINESAAITCNKPSGNSSQLLDCSSGIHRRWAPYYIRRTRVSAVTPLYRVLRDAGVPMQPENGQTTETADTWVVPWPVKAPEGAVTRNDVSAIEQCNFWLQNKLHWAEHNPSVTITYRPNEVLDLIKWVWDHREVIGGMAFLPASDAQYEQMPYEEITREEYEVLEASFPRIDFSLLFSYEHSDATTAAQELACLAGGCDV